MGRIQDTIFKKLEKKGKTVEDQIYNMHHTLMKEYGWIPMEEFKKLPMQTVNNLIEQINIERKMKAKKSKPKRGKK